MIREQAIGVSERLEGYCYVESDQGARDWDQVICNEENLVACDRGFIENKVQ